MTAAEKAAILNAYDACLVLLRHHAGFCVDAQSLAIDMEASLRRHMRALEAVAPGDPPKKAKPNG